MDHPILTRDAQRRFISPWPTTSLRGKRRSDGVQRCSKGAVTGRRRSCLRELPMRTYLECIPCFTRQTLEACRTVTNDPALRERILRAVLAKLSEVSFSKTPPHMGREIHAIVRELSGNEDPYSELKSRFNMAAVTLYPDLSRRVRDASDPFTTAVRLAIAGNIIDFGVARNGGDICLNETIEQALAKPLAVDHVEQLRAAVGEAKHILYIADNAGEIVFDRLLVEQLPTERVVVGVRGSPIINDATREDAEYVGLTDIVEVIDNGADAPGTILEDCSPAFRSQFEKADLVIAKGQGNYETLESCGRKDLFFLLMIKCPVTARSLSCPEGSFVVKSSGL